MNTILAMWCAFCDHAAPFAVMACVPLLMWVWHFETTPTNGEALEGVHAPDGLHHDALEGWAA